MHNLEPPEAVDGVGAEASLRLVVSLVSARPQRVEGEPRAPPVERRVRQAGGGERDAPKLVPILQGCDLGYVPRPGNALYPGPTVENAAGRFQHSRQGCNALVLIWLIH